MAVHLSLVADEADVAGVEWLFPCAGVCVCVCVGKDGKTGASGASGASGGDDKTASLCVVHTGRMLDRHCQQMHINILATVLLFCAFFYFGGHLYR